MIDELKAVLLEIRQEREDELAKYKLVCGNDEGCYATRKAILTLELPLKTDPVSLLEARALAYREAEQERNHFLGIVNESIASQPRQLFRKEKTTNDHGAFEEFRRLFVERPEIKTMFDERNAYLSKYTKKTDRSAYALLQTWVNSAGAATARARRTLYYLLVSTLLQSYCLTSFTIKTQIPSLETIRAEDLPYILTIEAMESVINALDVEPETKRVYLSHASNLRDFLLQASPITQGCSGRKARLSLTDIEKLFEFLETRALKSSTIRAYHDVLLCRALFYAPLPEKEFFDLGAPEESSSCLRSGDATFFVPSSFLKLWKAFSFPSQLLHRKFDERQLHKKIKRFGEYAGLEFESLTPSILRLSAKSAYLIYLSLSDHVVAYLPKKNT
jgi:hypothetical protein